MDSIDTMLIVGVVVAIILFIVLREFFTWYWKQNEIIKQLKVQNEKLDKITTSGNLIKQSLTTGTTKRIQILEKISIY